MSRRTRVIFRATKIAQKKVDVTFVTKQGRPVSFKAKKDIPKEVRIDFLAKPKKKK